jgi:hypothetical protein
MDNFFQELYHVGFPPVALIISANYDIEEVNVNDDYFLYENTLPLKKYLLSVPTKVAVVNRNDGGGFQ